MENTNNTPEQEFHQEVFTSSLNDKVKNADAEKVLGTLSLIILWAGIVICTILALVGLVTFFKGVGMEWGGGAVMLTGFLMILGAALLFLYFLVVWASIKLRVNISRNIFVIKDLLMKNQEK